MAGGAKMGGVNLHPGFHGIEHGSITSTMNKMSVIKVSYFLYFHFLHLINKNSIN